MHASGISNKRFIPILLASATIITLLIQNFPAKQVSSSANQGLTREQTDKVNFAYINITNQFNWRMVESPEYHKYVSNLTNIGCPRSTLIDIVVADVSAHFRNEALTLISGLKEGFAFPYWKSAKELAGGYSRQGALRQQLEPIEARRVSVIHNLLGFELPENTVERWSLLKEFGQTPEDQMLNFLSQDKRAAIQAAKLRLQTKVRERFKPGEVSKEDMPELVNLRKQFDTELSLILSREDKLQLDLRISDTAQRLRNEIEFFNASESEFQKIFQLKKSFDDTYDPQLEPKTPDDLLRKTQARRELNKSIQSVLGDSRYSEYARMTDDRYISIGKYAERHGIPLETAEAMYDIRLNAETTATGLSLERRNDKGPNSTLEEVRGNALKRLVEVLGSSGAEAYYKDNRGRWLDTLGLSDEVPGTGTTFFPAPGQ